MDFDLSEMEQDLQKAAREFAEGEFTDVADELDAREEYPMAIWKKACELGFIGTFIDEEYGIGRLYRDAKIVEIYEGAREIEKVTIAREIFGRNG